MLKVFVLSLALGTGVATASLADDGKNADAGASKAGEYSVESSWMCTVTCANGDPYSGVPVTAPGATPPYRQAAQPYCCEQGGVRSVSCTLVSQTQHWNPTAVLNTCENVVDAPEPMKNPGDAGGIGGGQGAPGPSVGPSEVPGIAPGIPQGPGLPNMPGSGGGSGNPAGTAGYAPIASPTTTPAMTPTPGIAPTVAAWIDTYVTYQPTTTPSPSSPLPTISAGTPVPAAPMQYGPWY